MWESDTMPYCGHGAAEAGQLPEAQGHQGILQLKQVRLAWSDSACPGYKFMLKPDSGPFEKAKTKASKSCAPASNQCASTRGSHGWMNCPRIATCRSFTAKSGISQYWLPVDSKSTRPHTHTIELVQKMKVIAPATPLNRVKSSHVAIDYTSISISPKVSWNTKEKRE